MEEEKEANWDGDIDKIKNGDEALSAWGSNSDYSSSRKCSTDSMFDI